MRTRRIIGTDGRPRGLDYEQVQEDNRKAAKDLLEAVALYIEDGKPLPRHPKHDLRMTLAEALQATVDHLVNASIAGSQIECRKRHGEHTHADRRATTFAAA
jgi:hypothetical protein